MQQNRPSTSTFHANVQHVVFPVGWRPLGLRVISECYVWLHAIDMRMTRTDPSLSMPLASVLISMNVLSYSTEVGYTMGRLGKGDSAGQSSVTYLLSACG